jgi:hypothetical protein
VQALRPCTGTAAAAVAAAAHPCVLHHVIVLVQQRLVQAIDVSDGAVCR